MKSLIQLFRAIRSNLLTPRDEFDAYLSKATSLADVEHRIQEWTRGQGHALFS